jgi:CIC family chloride channel protein
LPTLFDFRGIFSNVNTRTIYLYSILIGVLAGLGAVVFDEILSWATHLTMVVGARLELPHPHGEVSHFAGPEGPPRRWLLLVLPVLGGLISGLLVKTFASEAEGTGTDGYIDAFHNKGGVMRSRVPLVKSLATIATLSMGGSAGKEGPTAQIGAGIGSALGRVIKMGARARRTLMVAGAAAGLGAIFRAPLGGALTAVEVLYKEDLETDALTPAVLGSVTAYTVFCSIKGFSHIFEFEHEIFHAPIELLFYAVLGLVCSGAGTLYIQFLHGSRRLFFDRLPVNAYLVPPIGGLLVGVIGYFHPAAMGQGLGYVQQLILGEPVGGMSNTRSQPLHRGHARRLCRDPRARALPRDRPADRALRRGRDGGVLCRRGQRADRVIDDGLRADRSLRAAAAADGGGDDRARDLEALVDLHESGRQ